MKREQIIEILERFITESDDYPDFILKYNFGRVADTILTLPLDVPLTLSIYKKARTLSYHSFCEWFNNEIKKRNQ